MIDKIFFNLIVTPLKFVFISAEDPQKLSLTVKGALFIAVSYVIPFTTLLNIPLDEGALKEAVNLIGYIVEMSAQIITAGVAVYGIVRKVWLTVQGENKAFQ